MRSRDYTWPTKPQILTLWPFVEKKFANLQFRREWTNHKQHNGWISKPQVEPKESNWQRNTQNQARIWEGRLAVVLDYSRDWKRGMKYTTLFKRGVFHRCVQFVGNLTSCTLTMCVSTYLSSCNRTRESTTHWAQHSWQIMGTCNLNY